MDMNDNPEEIGALPDFSGPDFNVISEFNERFTPILMALRSECKALGVTYLATFVLAKDGDKVNSATSFDLRPGRTPNDVLDALHAIYPVAFGSLDGRSSTITGVSDVSLDPETGRLTETPMPEGMLEELRAHSAAGPVTDLLKQLHATSCQGEDSVSKVMGIIRPFRKGESPKMDGKAIAEFMAGVSMSFSVALRNMNERMKHGDGNNPPPDADEECE